MTLADRNEIVPRRRDLVPRLRLDVAGQQTDHRRYDIADSTLRNWVSYASQRHVRDIAVDAERGRVWCATWGGVLCWEPEAAVCIRHTSEHGLLGNATRTIAVDEAGRVWAAGQDGGVCSLEPQQHEAWRPYAQLQDWTVLCLATRGAPSGGIYAAVRDSQGGCAIREITATDSGARMVAQAGLAVKDVQSMCVTNDGAVWLGNAWGIHRCSSSGVLEAFEVGGQRVRALVPGAKGSLWVGTRAGVYHFRPEAQTGPTREPEWPRDEVVSLTAESDSDAVWVATVRQVGRIVDNVWQAVRASPPDRVNALAIDPKAADRVWVGTATGLYQVGEATCAPAFTMTPEDTLSNAVRCVSAGEAEIWIGAARGLYRFDGQNWQIEGRTPAAAEADAVRDVCAMVRGHDGRLWIGMWAGGPAVIQEGVYIPSRAGAVPVVSLVTDSNGTLWAATPDAVHRLLPGTREWEPVDPAARRYIGQSTIQTLCPQFFAEAGGEPVLTLWVGTSAGLFRYRPGVGLWDSARQWATPDVADSLEQLSIQALVVDPLSNRLVVGTPDGLFCERPWRRRGGADIRALAFASTSDLWVGTSAGLERWSFDGVQRETPKLLRRVMAADSGLAANWVTALAVRATANEREVWVGSPAGVSRFRYSS